MIDKQKRIKLTCVALIGSPNSIRDELSHSLSITLNTSQILTEPYRDDEIYNIRMSSMEQVIKGLSYFHKNVKSERREKSFVSNGSVLNGYLLIKAMYLLQSNILKRKSSIYDKFEDRLIKIIGDYMRNTYNHIYFVKSLSSQKNICNSIDVIFESIFYNLSKKIGLQFHFIQGDLESCIDQIQKQQEIAYYK